MSNSDWLRLTIEDISAQNSEDQRTRLAMPPVLIIRPDEVPDSPPPATPVTRAPLQVTAEDLAAFEPAGDEVVGELEKLLFDLINAARHEHIPNWMSRGPLRWHPVLATAARQHSNDMLQRNYVSHNTPDGLNVSERLNRLAISYLACGENIGVVYGPASHGERGVREVHQAFMNQPRRLTNHRGNILNPVWTHVGIGVTYAPEGRLIVTENFITTLTKPA
jgi:uncharacterized protein YkwD